MPLRIAERELQVDLFSLFPSTLLRPEQHLLELLYNLSRVDPDAFQGAIRRGDKRVVRKALLAIMLDFV